MALIGAARVRAAPERARRPMRDVKVFMVASIEWLVVGDGGFCCEMRRKGLIWR
jgi:hypothetical protein